MVQTDKTVLFFPRQVFVCQQVSTKEKTRAVRNKKQTNGFPSIAVAQKTRLEKKPTALYILLLMGELPFVATACMANKTLNPTGLFTSV